MNKAGTQISHVDVDRVAHTGEGVATLDGKTLLVRGALPGERVRVEVVHRGKIDRARVLSVVTPSDDRVEPPCAHAKRCGGCDLMHASPQLQREIRARGVLERLRPVSLEIENGDVEMVHHPSGEVLAYRSRARLRIHAKGKTVQVGYRQPRSQRLAAIDTCVVLRPELEPLIGRLPTWLAGSDGTGEAQVAIGAAMLPVMDLAWSGKLATDVFKRLDEAVREGTLGGVQVREGDVRKPATFGDPSATVPGADGEPLRIPPRGFAQASDVGGRLLAERVGALAGLREGGLTIELFAGSGTLTVAARPAAERYIAVEDDEASVMMLRENMKRRGLDAKALTADAETFALKRPVATVILDPPRSGAPGACANVRTARPRQIIYASCNPATLARDLAILADYRVTHLELVDLFPHTSHVETLVRLERR